MTNGRFSGVVTPVLTPFGADGAIEEDLFLNHCRQVLAEGSDYVSPFGTTGEALSLSIPERAKMLERIVLSGAALPSQMMPGTGLCSMGDTLTLTRHAVALGAAAVMVLPPFFYPDPGVEGLYRYFSELIEKVSSDRLQICLYHIPQNAGVGIAPELAARLNEAFPEIVTAYKDSSGNWDNTVSVIAQAPGISVFPASETVLPKALALGAAGCISATCNVNVAQIKRVYMAARAGDLAALEAEMPRLNRIRSDIQAAGLIRALKSVQAAKTGDAHWLNTRAPLLCADSELRIEMG